MQLYLFHGRKAVDEQLEDWGFEGPTLVGVEGFHCTYFTTYRVVFNDKASFDAAQALTGWRQWDELSLEMEHEDDMVRTIVNDTATYYGDWGFNA